jgi:hypothetical protein
VRLFGSPLGWNGLPYESVHAFVNDEARRWNHKDELEKMILSHVKKKNTILQKRKTILIFLHCKI